MISEISSGIPDSIISNMIKVLANQFIKIIQADKFFDKKPTNTLSNAVVL